MAQQGISTRELNIGGAAGRQVAQLNQQTGPDHSASNKQLRFIEQLTNIGDPLIKKMRQEEIQEAKIKDASDKKAKDEEAARLRVAAHKQLLATQGQDYKDAHSKTVNTRPDGQGGDKKVFAPKNPDVLNPIYKKEYELAFTTRKVEKFQKNLDLGAEKDIDEIYTVWEKLYKVPGSEFEGIPFEHVALTALTDRKDAYYAQHLQHLPHLGEVISQDKYKINYTAHEKAIAKKSQEFIDGERLKYLDDATHDFYVDRKYPKEKTKNGKTISAASDLFNQAEALQGKVITDKGMQGFYTKKEIHGAFIKQYSEQIFLAKSPDDPIFESINAIFDSPDAYRLLGLDPNDKNGTGSQYAALKDKAYKKYLDLKQKADKETEDADKEVETKHTQYINSMYIDSEVLRRAESLDLDELESLQRKYRDKSQYNKGKSELVDDIGDNIDLLVGFTTDSTKKVGRQPLTKIERTEVNIYKDNIIKIKDLVDLKLEAIKLENNNEILAREKNAKFKIIDAHEENLKAIVSAKKDKVSLQEQESTSHRDTLVLNEKENIKGKKSTELKEGLNKYKEGIKADKKLTDGHKAELITARETEIESREQIENDESDVTYTTKFNELARTFNPNKIKKSDITKLEKILPKIKNGALKSRLEDKITDIAKGVFSQEELEDEANDRKAANKHFSKLNKELNLIREMDPAKGQQALETLQITLEKNKDDPSKISSFVEEFLTATRNDPAKRDWRDMLSTVHGELETKKKAEQIKADQETWQNAANNSETDREAKQGEGQKAYKTLKTKYTIENYNAAEKAIFAKIFMQQADGSNPIEVFVFPEERRLALWEKIRNEKTANSGQVPTIKELDPKIYTKFQNDIDLIEDLTSPVQKEAEIKLQLKSLQKAYETYTLPQTIYKDLYDELKKKNPKGPTIVDPRINGLKILKSKFQGNWSKFDDPEEFLAKGGREGPNLYSQARKAFEDWHTAWVTGTLTEEESKGVRPYKSLNEREQLAEASKYVDRILDYESGNGVMDKETWQKQMEIYDNSWNDAWKKQSGSNVEPASAEDNSISNVQQQDNTSTWKVFGIEVVSNAKKYE